MRRLIRPLLLLALALMACAYSAQGPGQGEQAAFVVVENHNWKDVRVYVVRGGMRDRLGIVVSQGREHWELRPMLVGVPIRILLRPISGGDYLVPGVLILHAGRTLDLTVGSRLAMTSYSIR